MIDEHWCIGGDLYKVLYLEDRNGRRVSSAQSKNFHEWVTHFALIDNLIKNVQYTWSNFKESAACSKIDRIFTSTQWQSKFPESMVTGLPRPVSDHCPLLLDTPKTGPKYQILVG